VQLSIAVAKNMFIFNILPKHGQCFMSQSLEKSVALSPTFLIYKYFISWFIF